jgi:hypothetical protein
MKLRFVEGGGWDSKVIRWDTRCRWSHVEAFYGDYTVGAMLKDGVARRALTDPVYRRAVAYQIVEINTTVQANKIFDDFNQQQIGKPYDVRAIIGFGMGERDWRNPSAWFCSEDQVRALELAGIVQLPDDIPMWRITPRDVWLLLAGKVQLLNAATHQAMMLGNSNLVSFCPVVTA